MDIQKYLELRKSRSEIPKTRIMCTVCLQPEFTCYCSELRPFDPGIKFVILIHPLESRKKIATGRMTHLSLKNSRLIEGYEYTDNHHVNEIIADKNCYPIILYPGRKSTNLTPMSLEQRSELFPSDKELVVFVIDGTWNTARRTMHRSKNFHLLPRISFRPPAPSRFRIRRQPTEECYSTIEAVHHTIELLGPVNNFDLSGGAHQGLLHVFDHMVEQRLSFRKKYPRVPRHK